MRAPVSWLRELAPTKLSTAKLAEALTLSGTEVTHSARVDGDTIFEMEITPNRADCLSIIGLAREVAAITGVKLRVPNVQSSEFGVRKSTKRRTTNSQRRTKLRIGIQDKTGCSQYIGRRITGVTAQPSPDWMQQRLTLCGIRPINVLVDITNYVLLEWGQPLHAFDWATIRGGRLVVRRARVDEPLQTIDTGERTLDASMTVIADAEGPVAIAGVMGGAKSAITDRTTEVLLESAQFDPRRIRRTARTLALHSESSYRFERGVDAAGVATASARAAQLLCTLAGGTETAHVHAGHHRVPQRTMVVVPAEIQRALGAHVPIPRMKRMLTALGCGVRGSANRWTVTTPSHRADVTQPVDYVEEVARLYGYAQIPAAAPSVSVRQTVPLEDPERAARARIRELLVRAGLHEAVTWSLVPARLVTLSGLEPEHAIRVANPLSQEQAYLRPAIWPRLADAVALNLRRQAAGIALFEIGRVYQRSMQQSHTTAWHLSLAFAGERPAQWSDARTAWDLFALKGVLEGISAVLGAAAIHCVADVVPALDTQHSARCQLDDTIIGTIGALHQDVLQQLEVKQPIYVAEWELESLLRYAQRQDKYTPLARAPWMQRDISFIVQQQQTHAQIAHAMREAAGPYLTDLRLIDRYTQPPVPQGAVGLTFQLTFQHPSHTLTDAQVNHAQQAVAHAVTRLFSATIRTS